MQTQCRGLQYMSVLPVESVLPSRLIARLEYCICDTEWFSRRTVQKNMDRDYIIPQPAWSPHARTYTRCHMHTHTRARAHTSP